MARAYEVITFTARNGDIKSALIDHEDWNDAVDEGEEPPEYFLPSGVTNIKHCGAVLIEGNAADMLGGMMVEE
jgi:hypothetical protein